MERELSKTDNGEEMMMMMENLVDLPSPLVEAGGGDSMVESFNKGRAEAGKTSQNLQSSYGKPLNAYQIKERLSSGTHSNAFGGLLWKSTIVLDNFDWCQRRAVP